MKEERFDRCKCASCDKVRENASKLDELRALYLNDASWVGGYELTGEAGDEIARILGIEPRCEPSMHDLDCDCGSCTPPPEAAE